VYSSSISRLIQQVHANTQTVFDQQMLCETYAANLETLPKAAATLYANHMSDHVVGWGQVTSCRQLVKAQLLEQYLCCELSRNHPRLGISHASVPAPAACVQASRSARDLIPAAYSGLRIGTSVSAASGSSSASSSKKQLLQQRPSGDGANWLEQLPSKKADTPRAIYAELQSLQVGVISCGQQMQGNVHEGLWQVCDVAVGIKACSVLT
jgi:hypothetical protein